MSHFLAILYRDQTTPTWVVLLLLLLLAIKMVYTTEGGLKARVWDGALLMILLLVLDVRYVVGPGHLALPAH